MVNPSMRECYDKYSYTGEEQDPNIKRAGMPERDQSIPINQKYIMAVSGASMYLPFIIIIVMLLDKHVRTRV